MADPIRVGINGFGRIGRLVARALLQHEGVELMAVNDPNMSVEDACYFLKYDTMHRQVAADVSHDASNGVMLLNGAPVKVTGHVDPAMIPWQELGVDYVAECSGKFLTLEAVSAHMQGGARAVALSAPSKDIPMFVVGVNDGDLDAATQRVVSAASCTTNCLAPLAKVVDDAFGIENGLMSVMHACTVTQNVVDGPNKKDRRRGRAASHNIIPTQTGSAKAVGKVLPNLAGKFTGLAFRVPVLDVGVVDLTVNLKVPTNYADICAAVKKAAAEGPMKGILGYTDDAVVSSDFIGDARSTVFDATAGIQLTPTFVKLITWSDNEWAYASRVLDLLLQIAKYDLKHGQGL